MIVIEGPDGSGKTTLAYKLAEHTNWLYYHGGDPPKTKAEVDDRIYKMQSDARRPVIYDRCTLISEQIYGPIFRNKNHVDYPDSRLLDLYSEGVTIIYCRPYQLAMPVQRIDEDREHHEATLDKQRNLLSAYDQFFIKYPHVRYNFQENSHLWLSLMAQQMKGTHR